MTEPFKPGFTFVPDYYRYYIELDEDVFQDPNGSYYIDLYLVAMGRPDWPLLCDAVKRLLRAGLKIRSGESEIEAVFRDVTKAMESLQRLLLQINRIQENQKDNKA